jgi:hypothetical protein
MAEWPDHIAVFPLPDVVLFPRVVLPLHIFEPRYRAMVRDVSEQAQRLIGMTLLRGAWREHYEGCPEIFPVGCAGRMVKVEPLSDGRFNIVLHGVREFEVVDERRDRAYRQACVRWRPAPAAPLPGAERARLRALLERYLQTRGLVGVERLLAETTAVPDEALVNAICYACDFTPVEKQALLEAAAVEERAARLCAVLEFAVSAGHTHGAAPDRYH